MIDAIFTIAKTAVAVLPFVILCFSAKNINLNKLDRCRQYPMPIFAVVFVFVMVFTCGALSEWLLGFIKSLPKMIAGLTALSWLPDEIKPFIIKVANVLKNILKSLNLRYWIFFITNTVIMIGYLAIKKVVLAIIDRFVKTSGKMFSTISEVFYGFFFARGAWCLRSEYVQARKMFKIFYYAVVIMSSVLMIVSRKFYFNGMLNNVFYPVFGVIVLGEIFFYLDGTTKREFTTVLGEDENAYKMLNYSLLRKYLRSLFKDKLLSENTSVNNNLSYDITTDDIIRELEQSEDQRIVSFSQYMKARNALGYHIDHNYLRSTLSLMDGKSILFNNPFYNDLIPYAFYPMNRHLLAHNKVLVVLGRHGIEGDIKQWLEDGVESVTNIPFMWNIGVLGKEENHDLDIGIITRSDVLNLDMLDNNNDFLEKVSYMIIVEPSKLVTTAQIGLNLIVKRCKTMEDRDITYCICDKNCDGLVDSLSHILLTNLTEVSATRKHAGTSSHMCWETDDEYLHHRLVPNISRYLGFGTELSFAALKNQVSNTEWYGGEAFPVADIHWIDKQYYYDLTKFANLSTNPDSMDEHFKTSSNFWSAKITRNNFFTVEDESYNMFEILREFSTRTTEQGFVNVISPEYLMKDYMAENASIFITDAKAVPYIVADYTRSNRNTILRLLLMLSTKPVSLDFLKKEFSIIGYDVYDIVKQLWFEIYNCFGNVADLSQLPQDYREAVHEVSKRKLTLKGVDYNLSVISESRRFNMQSGINETVYSIEDYGFCLSCVSELESASYIVEDEKGQRHFIGAELRGHIYQKHLPGQFFTFNGKYYEMQYITADGQALVRRAADHINGRVSYRQIRNYIFNGIRTSDKIGSVRDISGMRVIKEFVDFDVETDGYYAMTRYNDFNTGKKVLFDDNKTRIPTRRYFNKEVLKIVLPQGADANIRYTITVLFNELFRSLFAENQAYICALTDDSSIDSANKPFTYSLSGKDVDLTENAIYIVEDSQLDLGLTVAVERNLERIFKIITDYLEWHFEALDVSLNPPEDPDPGIIFTPDGDLGKTKKNKKGIKVVVDTVVESIKKLLGKLKKEKPETGEEPKKEEPIVEEPKKEEPILEEPILDKPVAEEPALDEPVAEEPTGDEPKGEDPEEIVNDLRKALGDYDTPGENSIPHENCFKRKPKEEPVEEPEPEKQEDTFEFVRKPYHERYYLLYGNTEVPSSLNLQATYDYLVGIGMGNNQLKQARAGKELAALVEATFKPGKAGSMYCDFCGAEIFGVEYETLADGRDRCLNCGRTAVKSEEEFQKIFEDVKRNMESAFGIRFNVGVRVEMVNAKTLHKRLGQAFVTSPEYDGRVIGVAIKDRHGYSLYIENGSPRMSAMLTIAHELTHIWQYVNWNDREIVKKYGKDMRLQIYEGMAKWVEVQYAYVINEPGVAKREEIINCYREDDYGFGFLRYRANYPFSTGTVITRPTPFMNTKTPLDPMYCGPFKIAPIEGIGTNDGDDTETGKVKTSKPTSIVGLRRNDPDYLAGEKNRDPSVIRYYAREQLTEDEKIAYDIACDAISQFKPETEKLPVKINSDQFSKIYHYIGYDRPEFFWYYYGLKCILDADGYVDHFVIEYCMSKEDALVNLEKLQKEILPFIESISDDMSDFEVVLRVYENIINLIDYDTVGLDIQDSKPESERKYNELRTIYDVFINKKAVCAGYARATQYLLQILGIECVYLSSGGHAWNLVKLEGDYYHLDTTWGDGSNTDLSKNFSSEISYNLFCITTEEVTRHGSHDVLDDMFVPVCTAIKCNYYYRMGLYVETYNATEIADMVSKCYFDGCKNVSLKLSDSAYAQLMAVREDSSMLSELFNLVKTACNYSGSISFSYNDNSRVYTVYFN